IDLPATEILPGIILTKVPNTMKKGPNNVDWNDTIHAVAVVPTCVPKRISKLSRNVMIPVFTKETVRDETNVLDCIIPVTQAPNAKLRNFHFVKYPIHLDSFSSPKCSISLLKLCKPYTNNAIAETITITVCSASI